MKNCLRGVILLLFLLNVALGPVLCVNSFAQEEAAPSPENMAPQEKTVTPQEMDLFRDSLVSPRPIDFTEPDTTLDERLARKITLDVREMSIIDVLKFLAMNGNFNLVTHGTIQGRATFYLKSVSIKDALDIAILSSRLAYVVENDIIRVMTDQEYEVTYGKKFSDNSIVEIVQLKYAKPSYVLAALENIKSALGRIIIDEDTGSVVMIDSKTTVEKMKQSIQDMERPLESIVYDLQYAKADVVAEKFRARIDAHSVGTITVDERTNQLIVRAFPERRKEIEALIVSLDKPTQEVLVEARVLQVVFKPQEDYGIDWQMDFRDSEYDILRRMSVSNIFMDESNLSSNDNLFSKYARYAVGNFDVNKFELAIRALKSVSNTKILSNPKLLVTNNEEAKIHVGDTVPYIISTTSGTGDNAITSEDVRFVDVGLKLNVRPTINSEGFVTMVLKPEISTVVGSIESQGGGIPQVNKTLVETTVMVKDGMTIVLGGLKKENKVHVRKGLPVLMDIPFVKRLFSSESNAIEATEIVIFITPHIVSGDEPHTEYRGHIKSQLDYEGDERSFSKQGLKLKE
ncbi:MAG: secretin N-terminal domain-containing protein [Candidatus Omnitrophota bacterium]|jgi:type II secretory pathway component GspD/PulD (secretin)